MAVLADAPRELDILNERAMVLEQQLADVKKRLETLQKEDRS
jgi:predicted  nucleic acid-binding Zn-ribbon protein